MGVEFMSDKTIENIGIISIFDMYNLTKEELEKKPGFGERKAEIIINEIQNYGINKISFIRLKGEYYGSSIKS